MSALVYISGAMPSVGLDNQPVTATLSFYEAETAEPTPVTVYADAALSVPHAWPVQSDSSGRFPAIYVPDDGVYRVAWATSDGQAESYDEISGMTTVNGAILAGALTAKAGAEAAEDGAEAARDDAQDILNQVIAYGGSDGWTPVLATPLDGARVVVSINWTGGDGPAPTSGYLGSSGVVTDIASATDIRGYSGSGSGDVVKFGAPTTGNLAIWSSSSTIRGDTAYSWTTLPDKPAFATQAEALAGVSNTLLMSPLRVAEVFATASFQQMSRLSKSANYQLVSNDRGCLLEVTANIALSFDSPSGLGTAWFAYVSAGSYEITVTGADGLSSYLMYPGEVRLFQSNGTNIKSVVVKGFSKVFTATGTFTKPPGYADFEGEAWGGGGSGCTYTSGVSGGGGGGACVPFKLQASTIGTTETVTIGAGGASPAADTAGNTGGTTTFGTLVTAYGGGGGGSTGAGGGGGGAFSAGFGNLGGRPTSNSGDNEGFGGAKGASGTGGDPGNSIYGGAGGGGGTLLSYAGANSLYGGAGGGAANSSADTLGGTSRFGGNGGRGRYNLDGVAGSAPAGGGGATGDITKIPGAGARGELRIRGIT